MALPTASIGSLDELLATRWAIKKDQLPTYVYHIFDVFIRVVAREKDVFN